MISLLSIVCYILCQSHSPSTCHSNYIRNGACLQTESFSHISITSLSSCPKYFSHTSVHKHPLKNYCLVGKHQRFGRICFIHLQGRFEGGRSKFHRNVGINLHSYTTSKPSKQQFEYSLPWKPQNLKRPKYIGHVEQLNKFCICRTQWELISNYYDKVRNCNL